MSEVRLVGISKQYEGARADRPALERLDLTIPSGALVVLVGPSGCGKSTTLRIVAGLEEPTTGQVLVDGRDVTHVAPAQRDIAMVFQSYALYPHMTVFENLAFALRIRKLPDAEIRRRVEEVARSLAIESYLERRPKALSGGQRQRVAIGRAVVRNPKVFLFDEPLSNLDAKLRGDMRREIARIHQESRTTAMYVTHDQVEAMTLADHIVVLKDGLIQQVGSPMDIYDAPANRFVAGFFGTPSMNFLPAQAERVDGHLRVRGSGFELPIDDAGHAGDVTVGIRPERLTLDERPSTVPLAARVGMREMLGAEVVLHLESPAGDLTVRADARAGARPGDALTVWLDPRAVHLFDAGTEQRL
ncbi:MAG: sn-glycerol-3-phosphate ABC transporter ATP-binding protein UgpC [Kofleriaceae bacterium]|nr:sn-glycerol-3-phosphate ABC transporter ATP-binding protein UgpC [Kofleriaceae bacterium]MCB9574141.1 sn-glycerol-3-phosphate ABC transporter ATP-binding protein UgpC [Kofleriaceae bacterium]